MFWDLKLYDAPEYATTGQGIKICTQPLILVLKIIVALDDGGFFPRKKNLPYFNRENNFTVVFIQRYDKLSN